MYTRITNQTINFSAQRNLQANKVLLDKIQEQGTSRQAINQPSDDPVGTAKALQVRNAQAANAQYGRNIDDGNGWVGTLDTTLTAATNIMNRIRDLTVQGANDGSMSTAAKSAIASELSSLKGELLTQANATYLGRSVFAGNTAAAVAFDPTTYAYNGDPTNVSTVQRRVDANTTVRVDADGAATFGVVNTANPAADTSVFTLIDNIVSDLNTGTNISARLTEIDQRMEAIRGQQAVTGTGQTMLDRASDAKNNRTVSLEAQRSSVEDVDLAKVILDLQTQQTTYQASLAITAKVLQPSLMDFLR
ncbi:MAG: flagellar hook-associated protein FlgL [Lacisediminihabitans sp.]